MDKFNISNTVKKKPLKLRNKLLNTILKISYLEKNDNLCNVLFNKSKTFTNPCEAFTYLSFSEILQNLLKYRNQKDNIKKIIIGILSNINHDEMIDLFYSLRKKIFSNYTEIDFFLNILIENFNTLKIKEQFLNEKIYEMIFKLTKAKEMAKENMRELLKDEIFRKMVIKIIYLYLNTKGISNIKNMTQFIVTITTFLNVIKIHDDFYLLLSELFDVLFIELYNMEYSEDSCHVFEKYKFIDNKKELSDLDIKPLDSVLFYYLESIINSFCSFNPTLKIINQIIDYFYQVQYTYYQIYLQEYRGITNNNLEIDNIKNNFILCNFFHIFKSKSILVFFTYLIKYAKYNNSKILEQFPDFKRTLINVFNLCPYPCYLNFIIEILESPLKIKENEQYLKEIMDMIMNIESIELNYEKQIRNINKYKSQYYNIIQLLKFFLYISYDSKINDTLCQKKIIEYFLKFRNALKKNNLIYSNFLITIEINDEKTQKTILEIVLIITYSIISKNEHNDILLNEYLEYFEIKTIGKEYGKSLFYIFDVKNKNLINNQNYQNEDFDIYLLELKCPKEERSLLITSLIYFITLETKKNKMTNIVNFITKYKMIFFNEIIILFNLSHGLFQKTKTDVIYDLILDNLCSSKDDKLSINDILLSSITEIITKNNKKFKEYESMNNISQIKKNDSNECYLKDKCLLLKQNSLLSFNSSHNKKVQNSELFGDYFNIELKNISKYLKKDLLLKDCSIYFDDIFFNDRNFNKIKYSFLLKYKKDLIEDHDEKFFNYPVKIKNYSCNKYFQPKAFIKPDIGHYKNKYFSVLHPNFNLELLKKDSFPNIPSQYDYYNDLYKKYSNNKTFSLNCELISPEYIIVGKIYLNNKFILFKNEDKFDSSNLLYIFHSESKELTFNKKIIVIQYKEIEEIITRSFLYNYQAFEIFLKNGKSYMFNLYQQYYLNDFYNYINKKILKTNEINFNLIEDPKYIFENSQFTKQWENNEISTYQYLLYLNKYSGRTYNDLNQYPIFPWIFLNTIENNNKPNLRNMDYFLLTQTEVGKERARKTFLDSMENIKKQCHFSIHYSTAAYIILYLMKISPFTEGNIKLQKGEFDSPDRQIFSIESLIKSIQKYRDNRELIPEYFITCEFFYNVNYIYFGQRVNKQIVHNTSVQTIFNSPEEYVYFNRLILNNQSKEKNDLKILPSCQISHWIDLIFGSKQYPCDYEKLNKFDNYCYRQIKSLDKCLEKYKTKKLTNEEIIKKISLKAGIILYFGQCPEQLFKNKHNSTKRKEIKGTNVDMSKKLDFVNINIKIITFWIAENKNLFFLIKNKKYKNMSILIYEDKLNKKYEIVIDKIKLFSCLHEFYTKNKVVTNDNKMNFACSILTEPIGGANMFNSFLVLDEDIKNLNNENNNNNYTLKDLCDIYALNPKDSLFEIVDDFTIYIFVGRNYDNSIKIYFLNKNIKINKNNNYLLCLIMTDSFVSVIKKIDNEIFLTGHENGKLIKWKIIYLEKDNSQNNDIKNNVIYKIKKMYEFFAHKYMISGINYNERHNIIMSTDIKGVLFIRKYYDFELINKIIINNNEFCFINKLFLNDYDIICTVCYNILKRKNYISFYSLNGLLLEESKNIICIDNYFLKNGKMIFNCLNESNLYIFGFNGKDKSNEGKIIEDNNILKEFEVKKSNLDYIKNFIIDDNNDIYILLKNGIFIKGNYEKLNYLSFGIEKNLNN